MSLYQKTKEYIKANPLKAMNEITSALVIVSALFWGSLILLSSVTGWWL